MYDQPSSYLWETRHWYVTALLSEHSINNNNMLPCLINCHLRLYRVGVLLYPCCHAAGLCDFKSE